jgi:hypothetical protein
VLLDRPWQRGKQAPRREWVVQHGHECAAAAFFGGRLHRVVDQQTTDLDSPHSDGQSLDCFSIFATFFRKIKK